MLQLLNDSSARGEKTAKIKKTIHKIREKNTIINFGDEAKERRPHLKNHYAFLEDMANTHAFMHQCAGAIQDEEQKKKHAHVRPSQCQAVAHYAKRRNDLINPKKKNDERKINDDVTASSP